MISETEKAKLQTGFKQAVRALNEDNAAKIFVAEDCDDKMKSEITNLASDKGTPLTYVPTMKELGSICEIEVGASCAVILK